MSGLYLDTYTTEYPATIVEHPPAEVGLKHIFKAADGTERVLPDDADVFPRQVVSSFEAVGEAPGGFISATGEISQDEHDAYPDIYTWGTTWRVLNENDEDRVVWAGRLTDPELSGGIAKLSAQGWGTLADKLFDHLLWQTRDLERWTAADSEPHSYDTDDQIEALVNGGRLRFKVRRKEMFMRATGNTTLDGDHDKDDETISIAINAGGLQAGERITIGGEDRTVAGSYTPGSTSIPITEGLSTKHKDGEKVHWRASGNPDQWTTGLVFWAPDVNLKRIAFTIDKQRAASEYDLQLLKADGPDGALTLVDTFPLSAGAPTNIDKDISGNPDLLMIRLRRQSQTEKAKAFRVDVKNVRVNALAGSVDDYKTHQVVTDLASRIGGNTDGIETSTRNALPLDIEEASAGELLDELAMLDDRYWGIEDTGTQRAWIYAPWNQQTWVVHDERSPVMLLPVERFNKVRVPFRHEGGVRDHVRATADPDPLAPSENLYQIDLDDPLPPKYIAEAFAENMADYLSQTRFAGEASFVTVEDDADPGTELPAWRVRPGDRIKLPNNNDRTLRIESINYSDSYVTTRFPEGHPLLERILARRRLMLARGRGQAWATLGGFDIDRPAVPGNQALAFKEVEKRGGRRKFHAVFDFDEVTEDINGTATAIRRYIVQFRPIDPDTDEPIPEDEGGGIRRVVIDRKDLDDPDTDDLPTRAIYRNVEHPHKWKWQARGIAVDVFGHSSYRGAWTPAIRPANFGPDNLEQVVVDLDNHKLRFLFVADDPEEDDADGDPMLDRGIARFKYRILKDDVVQTIHGKTIFRTQRDHGLIKIAKPGAADWGVEAKAVDHYGNTSPDWVLGTSSVTRPPAPLQPTSVTWKKGGKRGLRPTVHLPAYTGIYTDDDINKAIVLYQLEDHNPNTSDRVRRHVEPVTDEELRDGLDITLPIKAKKGQKLEVWWKVRDTRGHTSDASPDLTGAPH